jgi:acetoacetyl-CoA synthetase
MNQPVLNQSLRASTRPLGQNSNLKNYQNWLFVKKGLYFKTTQELWDWSSTDPEDFWESIWQFCNIKTHTPYRHVLIQNERSFANGEWFVGATFNYTEHVFRNKTIARSALMCYSESKLIQEVSWQDLETQVAALVAYFHKIGIGIGHRVLGVLPDIPALVVAFLATNAVGAVWANINPQLSDTQLIAQAKQIAPRLMITADGYTQNGKIFDRLFTVKELMTKVPKLENTILVPNTSPAASLKGCMSWQYALQTPAKGIRYTPVSFNHPMGIFKNVVYNTGSALLEHLKALIIHQNLKPTDRCFWQTGTDLVVHRFSMASLLGGATLVLQADLSDVSNWDLVERAKITHFGASANHFSNWPDHKLKHLQTVVTTEEKAIDWPEIPTNHKKEVSFFSIPDPNNLFSIFEGGAALLPTFTDTI